MTAAVPAPAQGPAGHLAGLEGIRGVACIAVITAHCWTFFAPVATPPAVAQMFLVGLVLFFAMSGLLIYLPFVRDIARAERRVDVRRYTIRRLARVFPAYLVIFLVADLVLGAVYVENAVDVGRPYSDVGTGRIDDPVMFLANLTLLQSFFPATIQTGINPAWSLTTELTFYVLLPLLAVPLVRWSRAWTRRAALLALLPAGVLLALGLGGRAWAGQWHSVRPELDTFQAEYGANGIAVVARSLLGVGDNFAMGMVIAVVLVWMERGRLAWLTRRRILAYGIPLVLACGAAGIVLHHVDPWFVGAAMGLAAAVVLLVVVEASARHTPFAPVSWAANRPMSYVGAVSLSVYLWHYPVIIVVHRLGLVGPDSVLTMVWSMTLVSLLSIALGSVTYRLVERPAMEWSMRLARRPGSAKERA